MACNCDIEIQKTLAKVASHSACTYRIGAVAFDKKGDILGYSRNTHRFNSEFLGEQNRRGTGLHAEARLMKRYGENIKSIIIMRIGRSGNVLPIDPCPACSALARKLGVEITTVLGRQSPGEDTNTN